MHPYGHFATLGHKGLCNDCFNRAAFLCFPLVDFMQKNLALNVVYALLRNLKNNAIAISERRQKLWNCLTRGMKAYEIVKELNINPY